MIVHKSSGVASGSFGSVSWLVGKERVIIMWSLPFNFNHHSNYLAVGVIKGEHTVDWTNTMYYKSGDFVRQEYYRSSPMISYLGKTVYVEANMGTGHKAVIRVAVYPQNYDDMEPSIKEILPLH